MKMIFPLGSSTAHCTSSKRGDLLLARLLGQVILCQALAAHVLLDRPAILQDHDWLALDHATQERDLETEKGVPICSSAIVETAITAPVSD